MRLLLLLNGSRERYAGGADEARRRKWLEYCSPGTELSIGYLPSESESGGVSKSYAFGSGNALKLASLYPDRCLQAERDGFDVVVIHCCADPGLREVRQRVRIPVVGPGEAALRACALIGRRIGITVPSGESVEEQHQQARDAGIGDLVIWVQPVTLPVGEYAKQDPGAMVESLVEAAQKLVDRGADVIFPSGLAYVPVRVPAAEVSERIGVPVVDPALIAVRTAEMLVEALPLRVGAAAR